jgi:hypothetical protein
MFVTTWRQARRTMRPWPTDAFSFFWSSLLSQAKRALRTSVRQSKRLPWQTKLTELDSSLDRPVECCLQGATVLLLLGDAETRGPL